MDRNDSNSINNKNQIREDSDNNVEKVFDAENTADSEELDEMDFLGSDSVFDEAEDSEADVSVAGVSHAVTAPITIAEVSSNAISFLLFILLSSHFV